MKQDYEIEQQEDEDLRCPICNYYFSNVTKPYLLPCNHNLCSQCINSLIKKKMYNCPICRSLFEKEAHSQFKVIYCKQCSKVFNWSDHQSVCDQSQFKEVNEIFDEVNKLAEESTNILKSFNLYQNMLSDSKRMIYNQIKDIIKQITDEFEDQYRDVIEDIYKEIPIINFDSCYENIANYLKLCEPLTGLMNINSNKINHLLLDQKNLRRHSNAYSIKKITTLRRNQSNFIQFDRKLTIDYSSYPNNHRNRIISSNSLNRIKTSRDELEESKSSNIDDFIKDDDQEQDKNFKRASVVIVPPHQCHIKIQNCNSELNISNRSSIPQPMRLEKEINVTLGEDSFEAKENEYYIKLNKVIPSSNKTKQSIQNIKRYRRQLEYVNKTMIEHISKNHLKSGNKINSDLNGIIDSISLKTTDNPRQFLINYIENTKKIWIYDSSNNTCEVREYSNLKFKFNNSIGIEFNQYNTVYVTGGKFDQSIFTDDLKYEDRYYIIRIQLNPQANLNNVQNGQIIEFVGQMPRKRAMHSSLFFKDKLYIIGGEGDKRTKLRECECYNSTDKRWELMPSLNCVRIKPSLCIYNNTYLYAFQGDSNINSFIEYINIDNFDQGWVGICPNDPGSVWFPSLMSSVTVLSQNQILICGGSTNKTMINYTYIYDPVKKVVFRGKDICHPAIFSSTGVIHNGKLITIDVKNNLGKTFGFHIYDIQKNHWTFL